MWLPYDERYDVSDDGLVRRKDTGLILFPTTDHKGYLRVGLCHNNKETKKFVHRMVAERFLPKINIPKLQVDHIDHITGNPDASNLRWRSARGNRLHTQIPASNINYQKSRYFVRFRSQMGKKTLYCKSFKTLEEATVARDAFKLTDAFLSA